MQWPNHDIQPPRKPHGSRIERRIHRYPPPVSGNAEPSSMYAIAVNIVTTKLRPNARTRDGPVIAKPGPTSRKIVVPIVGPSPIIVISSSPRSRRNLTSTSRPCAPLLWLTSAAPSVPCGAAPPTSCPPRTRLGPGRFLRSACASGRRPSGSPARDGRRRDKGDARLFGPCSMKDRDGIEVGFCAPRRDARGREPRLPRRGRDAPLFGAVRIGDPPPHLRGSRPFHGPRADPSPPPDAGDDRHVDPPVPRGPGGRVLP